MSAYDLVPPQLWMLLPKDVRDLLVLRFDIPKTGISEIRDQDLISDGRTVEDLKAITLEKMCIYIGSEETYARAWELTCAKAKYELSPPPIEIKSNPIIEEKEIVITPSVEEIIKTKTK